MRRSPAAPRRRRHESRVADPHDGRRPAESFQIHLGGELLIGSYVDADLMEPLDTLYADEGWDKVFPPLLIEIASKDGKPWSVPVNIHRANVLWATNKPFEDIGAEPPKTWDEFFVVAEQFKEQGIPAILLAENAAGFTAQVWETMLIAIMGPGEVQGPLQRFDKLGTPGHDRRPGNC